MTPELVKTAACATDVRTSLDCNLAGGRLDEKFTALLDFMMEKFQEIENQRQTAMDQLEQELHQCRDESQRVFGSCTDMALKIAQMQDRLDIAVAAAQAPASRTSQSATPEMTGWSAPPDLSLQLDQALANALGLGTMLTGAGAAPAMPPLALPYPAGIFTSPGASGTPLSEWMSPALGDASVGQRSSQDSPPGSPLPEGVLQGMVQAPSPPPGFDLTQPESPQGKLTEPKSPEAKSPQLPFSPDPRGTHASYYSDSEDEDDDKMGPLAPPASPKARGTPYMSPACSPLPAIPRPRRTPGAAKSGPMGAGTPPTTPKMDLSCTPQRRPGSLAAQMKSPMTSASPYIICESGVGCRFGLTLRVARGMKLGLKFSQCGAGSALQVTGIEPDSAISAWNMQPAAGKEVKVGDTVVTVNTASEPELMIRECETKATIKLTVVRGEPGCAIPVGWNGQGDAAKMEMN